VHVTFGASAAGSLRIALRALGRTDAVLYLPDDLSLGPINPPDPRRRVQWAADELGSDDDPALLAHIEEFWTTVTTLPAGTELVAWMSRRYVTEYCGFLELLRRVPSLSVVDVADHEFVGRDGAPCPDISQAFAYVDDQRIVGMNLLASATPVSAAQRISYGAEWQRVREHDRELRVLTPEGLTSVPIDHFDATILSGITRDWQSCARVMARALTSLGEGTFRQVSSDVFLFERLLNLIDDEVVEGRNKQGEELWSLFDSSVRLPK